MWSATLTEGKYQLTGWRPQARLLFSSLDLAVSAARLLARRLRTDAWSTSDGKAYSLVVRHRQGDEAVGTFA